jgi:hypothetical protein
MFRQQSPWEIGHAYYNQRDLYTRDARIDAAGYGRGPAIHPEEGSYAYHRETRPRDDEKMAPLAKRIDLQSREAWPWLNYAGPDDDPYFAFLRPAHRRSIVERLRAAAKRLVSSGGRERSEARARRTRRDADKKLYRNVRLALSSAPGLDASDIDVKVQGAIVALEGTVADERSRRHAGEVAGDTEGVRGVRNHLAIRKTDPRDSPPVLVVPLAAL